MSSQLDGIFIKRLMETLKTMNSKKTCDVQSAVSSPATRASIHARAGASFSVVSYGSICIIVLCAITIVLILAIAYTIVSP